MNVSDSASHRRDQISNFAEVLRNAPARQKVFEAVYRGKKRVKTISEIAKATRFNAKRVATIARPLAHGEKLFEQGRERIDGKIHTVYRKIDFVVRNKREILAQARDKARFEKYPTKTRPRVEVVAKNVTVRVKVPFRVEAAFLHPSEIDQFKKMRQQAPTPIPRPARLSEARTKKGIIRLLGDTRVPKDWGGENTDIFTTSLSIGGKKRRAAFALKGPATTGPLVPKKMGKNGDQFQRLFDAPADVFVVQYEGEIKESVHKLMQELARARAISHGPTLWCLINGEDTRRLRKAYPKAFG
jgi:hypothetical protein